MWKCINTVQFTRLHAQMSRHLHVKDSYYVLPSTAYLSCMISMMMMLGKRVSIDRFGIASRYKHQLLRRAGIWSSSSSPLRKGSTKRWSFRWNVVLLTPFPHEQQSLNLSNSTCLFCDHFFSPFKSVGTTKKMSNVEITSSISFYFFVGRKERRKWIVENEWENKNGFLSYEIITFYLLLLVLVVMHRPSYSANNRNWKWILFFLFYQKRWF